MTRMVAIAWPCVLLALMLVSAPTLGHFLNSPDMGYQLSLGRQVLLGKFPFVDMIQAYGPLVTLTSAAAQWVHQSVVPETVICSFGYCLAISCIAYVVVRGTTAPSRWTVPVGLVASLAAWFALARFYKWYYWCFPMLTLACCVRLGEDSRQWRFWRFAAGLIAGIGFLYRHDLGAACLVTIVVVVAARTLLVDTRRTNVVTTPRDCGRVERESPSPSPRPQSRGVSECDIPWLTIASRRLAIELAWIAGGFALPLACWFAVLATVGGPGSCWWYVSAILDGTSGMAGHWRLPLPRWDWRNPTSGDSCRFVLLVMMGLSYTAAILLGVKSLSRERLRQPSDAVALLAAGILGLAIAPQALFRPDTQHILQVIPPLLVVAALLVLRLFDKSIRVMAAVAYLAVLVFPFAGLRHQLRMDLAPPGADVLNRYRALAAGLDAADPANAMAQVARAVQRRTSPSQPILVTPLTPQVYFWADRPMSGLENGYAGVFSQDIWQQRNLEAVRRSPPALVVADRGFLRGDPSALLKRHNPELYAWLKERYPFVVAESGNFVILAQGM